MKQDVITTVEQWLGKYAQSRNADERLKMRLAGNILIKNKVFLPTNPALGRAGIMAELKLDLDCILAAFLCDEQIRGNLSPAEISAVFGEKLFDLIQHTSTTLQTIDSSLKDMSLANLRATQIEQLRRMLLASVADVRVILICMADRLQQLRLASNVAMEQKLRLAEQTMQIYVPIANRMGMGQLKWEMEDWSFRYLNSEQYHRIARMLDERRQQRESYVDEFVGRLKKLLLDNGIDAQVYGRAKHIYSIWRKMQSKGQDFDRVFDIRALRVLVNTEIECYTVLGVVHTQWQAIPGEFDDYLAVPKDNNYRSLHTAIIGPENKTVEVQIRTKTMHEHAEFGVAAHWAYKEGHSAGMLDNKVLWLRGLLDCVTEVANGSGSVEAIEDQLAEEKIYVLTPQGKIFDFPVGATPIDFAYRVHSELGHRCRGAKVNGRIVPLTYVLNNGEQVEVLATKHGHPSRDWLNPHLGYTKTSRARSKIRDWYNKQDYQVTVAGGRAILEREFRRMNIQSVKFEKLAHQFKLSVNDCFAKIGRGDLSVQQVINTLSLGRAEPERKFRPKAKTQAGKVEIQGVGNLLTHLAACCKPITHDPIIGYITQGRGVTVHRADCANVLRLRGVSGERLIVVEWALGMHEGYPVDIIIIAYERSGLVKDLTLLLSAENITLQSIQMGTNRKLHTTQIEMTVEISGVDQLSRLLEKMGQLANVRSVQRR